MSRITLFGKAKIIDDEIVVKEENDLSTIYKYLESRGFYNFIKPINIEKNRTTYEYKQDIPTTNEVRTNDIVEIVSTLHNKTSFNKSVDLETHKNILEKTKGYTKYLRKEYLNKLIELEYITYLKPSEQLFINNYSKIISSLDFIDKEINEWYKSVEKDTTVRVSQIHGNLRLDHLINSDNLYLISWSKTLIESPIKDFLILYRNEWYQCDFKEPLSIYLSNANITESEKKLLFIYMSLPLDYKETEDELENTMNMTKVIEYLYKTEELIRPYYSIK